LVCASFITGPAARAASCASPAGGGEWRSFGHDLSNTRSQPLEDKITPATALLLLPKWKFSIAGAGAGGLGGFASTPVIADGCLYAGTGTGTIFAVNADSGELVWSTQLPVPTLSGLTNLAAIFSLAVGDGRVYVNVGPQLTPGGPYTAALDQQTGQVLWKTVVDVDPSAFINSSVALINGMVFVGICGPENGPNDRRHPGGFALLDPATGAIITRTYVVSAEDDARGLKGASIWATPVWDPDTNYMYAGTGQPANKNRESSLSNAIIKVDVDPSRATFGEIVDSYHGDWDNRFDVDFGGSPILFTDSQGNTLVGSIQKSGKYHTVFADTMEQGWWTRLVDDEVALGDTSSGAYDGTAIYITADAQTEVQDSTTPNPGYLYALNRDNGTVRWKFPTADGFTYHLTTVAGGVVYTVTNHGLLIGIDASSGLPVLVRSLAADAADACVNLSSGVSVARNTVYAVCDIGAVGGGWIIAYSPLAV
jgi:outer membrane protein assembly factor BamB